MTRLALMSGSYRARSVIANAQRCVNLYPELNPKDAPVEFTHYPRPGLTEVVAGLEEAEVRGLYRATNGVGFAVIGTGVYSVESNWTLTLLGRMATSSGFVSMMDNGITLVIVDGSSQGWEFALSGGTFGPINDPTGSFVGADWVQALDGFLIFNVPGTNQFISSLDNTVQFDPTYIATKSGRADTIIGLYVIQQFILLIGREKTEAFYDAGGAQFPFQRYTPIYFEQGCLAKGSIASNDISVFWLAQSAAGVAIVVRARNGSCNKVSNHALEYQFQLLVEGDVGLDDARGCCIQQGGHLFYVLSLPRANQTWVFDETTEQWHEWAWNDPTTGAQGRHRINCHAVINGRNVVGDYSSGKLYVLDGQNVTDDNVPIVCVRGFGHVTSGLAAGGLAESNGRMLAHTRFQLDMECNTSASGGEVLLRWSDNRGATFGVDVPMPIGSIADGAGPPVISSRPQWNSLGVAFDRVYEVEFTLVGPTALNGAWLDVDLIGT